MAAPATELGVSLPWRRLPGRAGIVVLSLSTALLLFFALPARARGAGPGSVGHAAGGTVGGGQGGGPGHGGAGNSGGNSGSGNAGSESSGSASPGNGGPASSAEGSSTSNTASTSSTSTSSGSSSSAPAGNAPGRSDGGQIADDPDTFPPLPPAIVSARALIANDMRTLGLAGSPLSRAQEQTVIAHGWQ